jgi:hypothetical protein
MPKGYWTASGQFLKRTGKLLRNPKIIKITTRHTFLLAGCDEKSRNKDVSQ